MKAMGKKRYYLLLLAAAAMLPAATISTSAVCVPALNQAGPITSIGGGPGSPLADCSESVLDRGQLWGNSADASVGAGSVEADYSVYRFAAPSVSASASYQETFNVTFFGASGFGIFEPSLSVRGSGGLGSATVTLDNSPVVLPGLGSGRDSVDLTSSSSGHGDYYGGASLMNCGGRVDPGNGFNFTFGQPQTFTLVLSALADETGAPTDHSQAAFLFSFGVSDWPTLQPIPGVTWDLEAVPEPSMAVPAGIFLAIVIFIARRRHLLMVSDHQARKADGAAQ